MPSFVDINTLRQRLTAVEDAIAAAVTGADYSIADRSLTRQSLPDLRAERDRLQRDIKRSQAYAAGVQNPSTAVATWHGRGG